MLMHSAPTLTSRSIVSRVLWLLVFALQSWPGPLQIAVQSGEENRRSSDSEDLVSIFKEAIASPGDVEYFLASQRTLRVPPELTAPRSRKVFGIQVFEGARSGTNFFIRAAEGGSNKMDRGWTGMVVGQAGSNSYQMNQNSLLRTSESSGSNPVVASANAFRGLVNQFLCLGLGDVEPRSVVWQGFEFTGTSSIGYQMFGHLSTSNGIPNLFQLSREKGGPAYKSIAYTYPNPHTAFGGFPSMMVISTLMDGTLQSQFDLALLDVRLAAMPIPEDAFRSERFASSNILYTNEYADGRRYWVRPDGKREIIGAAQLARHPSGRQNRVAILAVLVTTTLGLLLVFAKRSMTSPLASKANKDNTT